MASEPAEPTTRPQDDRVGTVRRLGNSWFMKLVEPASEPWHVVCSDGQQDVSGWQDDESMEDCPVVGYLPVVECVPSLLADPAQTTEHKHRAQVLAEEARNAPYAERDQLRFLHGEAEHQLERTAEELRGVRDALSLLLRGMARKLVAYRKWTSGETPTIHRVFNELRREADAADGVTLSAIRLMNRAGQERDRAVAERDERQAHIDAADMIATRAIDAALPADEALRMIARVLEGKTARALGAALVGDQGKHLGENQAKSGGSEALTSGNSWANRDLDLSGAALRAVEEADDAAGDLP